jgi:hypothetical protein
LRSLVEFDQVSDEEIDDMTQVREERENIESNALFFKAEAARIALMAEKNKPVKTHAKLREKAEEQTVKVY